MGSSLTPRVASLINESLAIEYEDAKAAGALGYMARALVQATMPHTDPGTHYFERTNGLVTLSIVNRPQVGVPYGSIPRTLLAWLCTEAVRTQNPELMLGKSQAEFMRKLNLASNGRDIARLKNQAHRLFSSMISLTGRTGSDDLGIENVVIAKRAMLFWNVKSPEQRSIWESTLTLTTDFYDEVTGAPIPIDLRVLSALSQSPLAMDIYTWLTYRVFLLQVKNRHEVLIPWEALNKQFGTGYGRRLGKNGLPPATADQERMALNSFRSRFMMRLREVLLYYPDAQHSISGGLAGLRVQCCKLHIPSMPKKAKAKRRSEPVS